MSAINTATALTQEADLRDRLVQMAADPQHINLHRRLQTVAAARNITVENLINWTGPPPLSLTDLVDELLLDYRDACLGEQWAQNDVYNMIKIYVWTVTAAGLTAGAGFAGWLVWRRMRESSWRIVGWRLWRGGREKELQRGH